MAVFENIRLAFGSLLANKLRALLTMLGIIIGIGSVVAIVTVGDSMAGSLNAEMSAFGGRNITVGLQQKALVTPNLASSSSEEYWPEPATPTEAELISREMIEEYTRVFGGQIEAVSTSDSLGSSALTNGRAKVTADLYAVNEGYAKVEKLNLLSGRFFTKKDLNDSRYLALVENKFVTKYWSGKLSPQDAIGKSFVAEVGGRVARLYIAGVFEIPDNGGYSWDTGDSARVLLPDTLGKSIAGKPAGYNSITILPKANASSAELLPNTNTFFASYYTQSKAITAVASSNASFMKSMNQALSQQKLGISAIAAISLLVGGIGVMNIMMVSVTERTREIGVRMALGAKGRVIRSQFVIEAMVICLTGGIIGVILGMILGSIGAKMLHFPAHPSIAAILIAVSFFMAIGLFFGWYPANKAARLDPIEALRYE